MPKAQLIGTIGDVNFLEYADGDVEAWTQGAYVGTASPWIPSQPKGSWYSRRNGEPAVEVADRVQALAYLARVQVLPLHLITATGSHPAAVDHG